MTFEAYTLLQPLGSGAFGEVWLAEDATKQRVALKISPVRKDEKFHAVLFKQEFALLSELKHAHLARVFDFGVSPQGDYYYFTEEICPGENFLKAVAEREVSFLEICLVQLLSVLDYIHAMGIIHFDIKAENILVEEKNGRPNVKLLDFGIAARLKSLSDFIGGTISYMAPELIQHRTPLDHRVDLYSLGMLLLRGLTGRLPFSSDNMKEVMRWHVFGQIPKTIWEGRKVPRHLKELTEKLLEKERGDRFSSARIAINFINRTTGHRYRQEEAALQPQVPLEGPLVGREDLLESLKKRIEDSLSKKGASQTSPIVILTGERGIGKSRILAEVKHWLEWKEIRFFQTCSGLRTSFWNDFCRWSGRREQPFDESDETSRARRQVDLVLEEAKKKPLGLLMDDRDRSDRETMLFWSELASRMKRERSRIPFFALVTAEEEEGTPLSRLSAEEVSQYCERILGKLDHLDQLSEPLFSYSGGLPLLMVEGLRYIAPLFLKGESIEGRFPPLGLESLYENRIEGLPPVEKEILLLLALLSRPVLPLELAHILDRPIDDLPKLLANIQRSGLGVTAYGMSTYQLSSRALGYDLIQRMENSQKTSLHLKIAKGLEGLEGTSPAELGVHWARANDKEKGRRYLRLAASNLKEKGQLADAAKYLAEAIPLTESVSRDWTEMMEEMVRLRTATGDFAGAESSLRHLEETTLSPSNLSSLKGLLAFKKRDFDAAEAEYRKALQQLPQDDLHSRIEIENALASIDLQSGRWDEAAQRFEKSLELEKQLPDDARQKVVGNHLGLALSRLGRFPEAIRFYEERLKDRNHDPKEEVSLQNALGYVFLQASRFAEAIAALEKARKQVQDHGSLHALFSILGNLVTAYFKETRYVESLEVLKETLSWQERFGSERDTAYTLLRQGSAYLILGMEEAAQDCFERGLSKIRDSDPVLVCWFRLMEAYREREYGDRRKAKEILKEILAEKDLPDQSHLAWASLALADILFDEETPEESRLQLDRIPKDFQDEEFAVRRDLLAAKISGDPGLFPSLEERCLQHHFLELLWEVYHAWGRALLKAEDRSQARDRMEKGTTVLRQIAAGLPEEYRDRYLHYKERCALLKDLVSLNEN